MYFEEKEQLNNEEEIMVTRGYAEAGSLQGFSFGNKQDIALTAYVDQNLIAAAEGTIIFDWLSINRLWVDENFRRQKLGTQLVAELEKIAKERGCLGCYLNTFDFQAQAFYEKLGYSTFGILKDCPIGHKRYFMQKKLVETL